MTAATLTKGFRAFCPAGHEHYARPMRPEDLPQSCCYPNCGQSLEWKRETR